MTGLTTQQAKCLQFIRDFSSSCGSAPSYDEIAAAMGFASKGNVARIIVELEHRGAIRRTARTSRSIQIIEPNKNCPHCGADINAPIQLQPEESKLST